MRGHAVNLCDRVRHIISVSLDPYRQDIEDASEDEYDAAVARARLLEIEGNPDVLIGGADLLKRLSKNENADNPYVTADGAGYHERHSIILQRFRTRPERRS